jgi:putative peptide zinc metalloprotease protein
VATETRPVRAERSDPVPPRLADGVELLGRFEDSGFEDPPYLARRADGQVIQLTELLHHVAEAADGARSEDEMAAAVSERFGRTVSADNIRFLAERKLRPLGVLARADGSSPQLRKADPLLALRYRTALVPSPLVQRLAAVFGWLFSLPVLALALGALVAFDAWLFVVHGVAGSFRTALYDPVLLLGLFGAVIAATAWHEVGHATACRYGGARPGVLGAGVYLVWPAFYCDITDAYRLSRRGRLRTDLGGVYFNGLFALATAGAFLATGFEPLLLVVLSQHLIALQQLIPLLRFDGYYVLSDLTGVPDILGRVGPILRSLRPGREPDERVTELKPWVRRVVVTYVALLVPVLLGLLVLLVISAPRIVATAYDSLGLQLDRLGDAGAAGAVLGVVQIAALALPCLAMALTASRLLRRSIGWARGGVLRLAFLLALLTLAAWSWWPNGEYEPIRPGERGTVGEAVRSVSAIPGGRASWTPSTAERHGDEPTVRERRAVAAGERSSPAPGEEREREGSSSEAEDGAPSSTGDAPTDVDAEPAAPGDAEPAPGEPAPSGSAGSAGSAPAPAPSDATPAPAEPAPAEQPQSAPPSEPAPAEEPTTTSTTPTTTSTTPTTTATEPPP